MSPNGDFSDYHAADMRRLNRQVSRLENMIANQDERALRAERERILAEREAEAIAEREQQATELANAKAQRDEAEQRVRELEGKD